MADYITFDRIDGLYHEYQRRVAAVIRDLYPNVRLLRLEPGHPSFNPERPYALVDEPNLAVPYVIRTLAESEIDARLIAWLVDNDTHKAGSKANSLFILEMAEKALNQKRELEYLEEKKDMMKSVMKSKKHEYRHDGKVLRK
jgi:hypothetical protein